VFALCYRCQSASILLSVNDVCGRHRLASSMFFGSTKADSLEYAHSLNALSSVDTLHTYVKEYKRSDSLESMPLKALRRIYLTRC